MSALPHRSADVVALCPACSAPATTACIRCGRPACECHAPDSGRRCGPCEADWAHRELAIVKTAPRKIDAGLAYRYGVLTPSVAVGSFAAIVTGITSAKATGIFAGLFIAAQAWMITFIAAIATLSIPYFVVGTPLFARRKIIEIARDLRHVNARLKFLNERANSPLLARRANDTEATARRVN